MTQFNKFFQLTFLGMCALTSLKARDATEEHAITRGTSAPQLPELAVTATERVDEQGSKVIVLSFPGFFEIHGGNIVPYLKAMEAFLAGSLDEKCHLHVNLSQSHLNNESLGDLAIYIYGGFRFGETHTSHHEKLRKHLRFLDLCHNLINCEDFTITDKAETKSFTKNQIISLMLAKCQHATIRVDASLNLQLKTQYLGRTDTVQSS